MIDWFMSSPAMRSRLAVHDPAEGHHRDLGGAAADVHDHVRARLGHRQARAERGGDGVLDQVDLAGARLLGRLADRAPLHLGDAGGHADDHARVHEAPPLAGLADEVVEHLLGRVEVGDDAVAERPDDRRSCPGPGRAWPWPRCRRPGPSAVMSMATMDGSSSPSPTAWAGTRPAKSRRSWPSTRSPASSSRSANDYDVTWPYGIDDTLSFDGNRLRTAIFLANRKVFRAAESSDDYGGMGTTIVGVLITGAHASIGSVGDSRVYLLVGGHARAGDRPTIRGRRRSSRRIRRCARGRSRSHPMRNVLTNVLGGRASGGSPRDRARRSRGGEVLLLCSDGIHGVLGAGRAAGRPAEHAGRRSSGRTAIVDTALDRGSRDNVTALVVRYEADK